MICSIGVTFAVCLYAFDPTPFDARSVVAFYAPLVVGTLALFGMPFVTNRGSYYSLQAVGVGGFLLALAAAGGNPTVQLVLLFAFITELILFEPYPLNLLESIGVCVASSVVRILAGPPFTGDAFAFLEFHASYLVPGCLVALFGSLMTKHRELVVDLNAAVKQLTESVVKLTKANTAYQDFAVDAGERATVSERQRITRDIHDIVGYTLTNNMMLMEAALDLMKENALALPQIIETARESAQEGLSEIRSALYRLRAQESYQPVGLKAIVRLTKTFEQATSMQISNEVSSMPNSVSDEIDSALYHLVQEALVNSYRHGRADRVFVHFAIRNGSVTVRVRDNGTGVTAISEEGIGLRGMKERILRLGGTIEAHGVSDGFLVAASIPIDGEKADGG